MSRFDPLTEDDILYVTSEGAEIQAAVMDEEGEWFIAYDHVDPESLIEMARTVLEDMGENPDDDEFYNLDPDDVQWVWAERRTPSNIDEWIIGWDGVRESTPNSFPLTVLSLW